jgi:CheY-like chemotaxis protein
VPAVVSKAPAQTRLLLVAGDRRFRTVASVLLTRRGYRVTAREDAGDMVEVAAREGTEVVVIEAPSLTQAAREAARLRALSPPIGVVAVSDDPHDGLATFPVLPKWGSFGALFDAIERARDDERRRRAR